MPLVRKRTFLHAAGLSVLAAATIAASGCTATGGTKDANVVLGKQLFVQKCGSCHTLARAGTKGTVGPNLDAAFAQSLRDGLKRSGIRGLVRDQIEYPGRSMSAAAEVMPAKLVTGQKAFDIATYVSQVVAKPGQDTGLLATAVQAAGGGKPAVEQSGVLSIAADPNGQLSYVTKTATATAGKVTIEMPNKSGVQHDLTIEGNGVKFATPIVTSGVAKASGTLKPGKYVFYCSVPGHRQAGMQGTLTVK
jgi:mono/diheme cytochrome c family protein